MTSWNSTAGNSPIKDPPSCEKPLVSVIVPSLNQGRFIERTLLSILRQDYRPLEIIVVDGASKDRTVNILQQYAKAHAEIRWISEPDDGPADAVNKGLALATGEIVGIQSSDDMYYAGAISTAVQAFGVNRQCGMVYGDSDSIDTEDRLLSHYSVPEFSWPAVFGISLCLAQQSVFFRANLAAEVGGWNGDYFGCDLDYWLRLMLRAPARKVSFTFSAWRCYPEQRTRPPHYKKILDGYRAMIDENQELKRAPTRLRRMAEASYHLMALRFHPTGNIWSRRLHLAFALSQSPGVLLHCPREILKPLIPGYRILRKLIPGNRSTNISALETRIEPGMIRPGSND